MRKRFNLLCAGVLSLALSLASQCQGADSVVRAHDMTLVRGETNTLFISLEALGTENALGFTLCYDTNQLTMLPPVLRGGTISNLHPTATFTPDTTGAESNGWIGLFIGLDAGEAWPAGTNFLVELPFRANAGTGSATTSVAFCDSVTARSLADTNTNTLAATFINSTVLLQGICTYQLSTNAVTASVAGSSNSINILTDFNCPWTVENTNSWITIDGDTGGTGNGSVHLIVAANLDLEPRIGSLNVAGQSGPAQAVTVTQDGIICSYSLSPTNGTHGHAVQTNSFNVTAPAVCEWAATTTNEWISLLSSTNGFGDGTVAYLVQANVSNSSRIGAIFAGGVTFSISQSAAPCDATLAPMNFNHGFGSETGLVDIALPDGCAWEVANTNSWIAIDSGAAGSGNGSVGYSLSANPSSLSRSGTLVIGGVPFLVVQSGAPCVFSISPTNDTAGVSGATNTVTITTISDCAWTISNVNAWITFPAGTNGLGSMTNTYHVEANPIPLARTGVVMLADQLLTIIQDPAPCLFTLASSNASHGFGTETGLVSVLAYGTCAWTATTTNTWITIDTGADGTGNGTVGYSIESNPVGLERLGALTIAGQTFVITQSAALCTFTLSPTNGVHGFNSETSTVSVTTITGCVWAVSNTNEWIKIESSSLGSVTYSLSSNTSTFSRSAVIFIAEESFQVVQEGAPCSYRWSLTSIIHSFGPTNSSVNLLSESNCTWAVQNTNAWISLIGSSSFVISNSSFGTGTGNATIDYALATNGTAYARTGLVTLADQLLTIIQDGTPCAFAIVPSQATHGHSAATNSIELTATPGCLWDVVNTNAWITFQSATNGTQSSTVIYSVNANTTVFDRVGVVTIGGEVITITQRGESCAFEVSPLSFTHDYHAATGSVNVTTQDGCVWAISNTNDWITISPTVDNTNSGSVTFVLQANPTIFGRTGLVAVANQAVTLVQSGVPCSYELSATNVTHPFAGATNSILLTTLQGCPWTLLNTNDWITFLSPTNGVGNTNIEYVVAANPFTQGRTGVVEIAGQLLTISQEPAPCQFALDSANALHGPGMETNSVNVLTLAGCSWSVSNSTPWINVLSATDKTNSGTVLYSVLSNPTALFRTGIVSIAGQSFTVTQSGAACTFQLASTHVSHGANSETGSVTVTTLIGCNWGVTNTNAWITITSGTNNSGSGEVSYAVLANPTAIPRTGTISIAEQTLTVGQAGAQCTFALAFTNAVHGSGSHTGSVAVITPSGCAWAVSNSTPWITILPPLNHTNSEAFVYVADANPTALSRTGIVSVAEQNFTIVQSGAACTFSIAPTIAAFNFQTATSTVMVTTLDGCEWNVSNGAAWITILSSLNKTNSGSVSYSVAENTTALSRTSIVSVAGQDFTVTQSGAGCLFALATNAVVHGAGLETNSVELTTLVGCTWSVSNGTSWIEILSPLNNAGSSNVSYRVLANPDALWRTGLVSIAGLDLTIVQSPAACTFTLATNAAAHGAGAFTNSVAVSTLVGCTWSVSNGTPWIQILSSLENSNSSSVTYSVEANPTALTRAGVLTIAGLNFTVTQSGAECAFTIASESAAHSFAATTGTVAVTTLDGCEWNVSNGTSWITVLSPLNNTNGGSMTYSVSENTTALSRTGVVSVAGQNFTVAQSGASCSFALATNAAVHGASSDTNAVEVTTLIGCVWSVSNSAPWIEILSPPNNTGTTGSTNVRYLVSANPDALWRTGIVSIAGIDFTVAQSPANCSFALVTNAATHGASVETNTVAVSTLVGCTWSVSNGTPWIQIFSSLDHSNSGTISYSVEANPTSLARSGIVRIAEQDFTITQSGADCSFDLDSFSASHGPGVENNLIQVTTLIGCAWSVSNVPSWILINTPLNNTNSGSVSYSVEANPTAIPRAAIIKIAGQDFAVEQDGAGCGFTLTTNSAIHSAEAATNSVGVSTLIGCSWTVENSNSWIIIQSPLNHTNDGVVSYSVLTNTTALTRVGVVKIAQRNFTITQSGADCTFALETNAASFNFSSATGSVAVTTLIGCSWPVSSSTPWISILSSLNNSNSGVVTYSVAENTTALSRTGIVSVAGQEFTVTQFGAACSFALATNNATHGPSVQTNSVFVTTLVGCTWTPSNGAPWITIVSPLNNTNSGPLTYTVATNPTALVRSGVIHVQGQDFTVTQNGTTCSFALSSNSASFAFAGGNASVALTTVEGCTWFVSNTAPWINLLSPANNTGSSTVSFSVESNSTALVRSGVITIAGQSFTITQNGAPCSFILSAPGAVVGSTSFVSSITVTTLVGCPWDVSTDAPWIQILSSLNNSNSGVVSYSVQSNSTALWRTGVVSIAGQNFSVAQQGASCSYLLSSSGATHGPSVESNSVAVTTLVGCTWNISNGAPWITILSSLNNSNSGNVNYSVQSNSTALWRTGVVNIAGQDFTVAQSGASCSYLLASNSAAHGPAASTNSVPVATLVGCPWTVSNGTPWITIQSPLNYTNSAAITYSISSNNSVLARTGIVSIAGQNFTVTQAPGLACTLALQSTEWFHRTNADPGVIGVISLTDCLWPISNTNNWVTITSGPNINGSGHVTYAVTANNAPDPRAGYVTIGDAPFLITQAGMSCAPRLSPTNRIHGTGANTNTITVTAAGGCTWNVLNTNDWLTILTNATGIGNQTVTYAVARNTAVTLRAGAINIGGDVIYITQWGTSCGFALNPRSGTHGPGAESGSSVLSASSAGCTWNIVNTNISWITINSASSGTGGGTVNYSVLPATNGTPRTGTFTVGGALFTVNQAGLPCSFTVAPTNLLHNAGSETGQVAVTTGAGCLWTVVNTNSWITSPLAGTNTGNLIYRIEANPSSLPRTGFLNVAGQNIAISQAGGTCTYSLATNRVFHGFDTEPGTVTLTTLVACPWTATTADPWININPPASNTGSAAVSYVVATNPAVTGRTGTITISGQSGPAQAVQVIQAGSPCAFLLSASSASHGGGAEVGTVNVSTDPSCLWLVINTNSWIAITNGGTGNRAISYAVEANPVFSARSGVVLIAGHPFTITQAPKPCTYVLTPENISYGSAPAAGSISVTASNECSWNVINSNAWITITSGTAGSGNGTVNYTVATNGGQFRIGNIFIGGSGPAQAVRISQAGSVRTVRALNMNVPRGQTNRLLIALESTGVENAMGFSLCFNTNHLSFIQAVRGPDATNANASFNVNAASNFLAQGQVGVALGLDIFGGAVFPAGSNIVAEILFRAAAGTTFTNTTIALCDAPIVREISGVSANVLPANYVPANVNILGNCTYALSTNALSVPAGGAAASVGVIAQMGCPWTATNNSGSAQAPQWITITSGASGAGSGTVTLSIPPNPDGLPRSASLSIAGQNFVVTQPGLPCTYAISPDSQSHSAAASSGLVNIDSITGCSWSIINTNPWVSIHSPTNGSGSATVSYSITSNTVAFPRTASLIIAGQSGPAGGGATQVVTINQSAAPCYFTLTPTNQVHTFNSETGLVALTSASGCPWTVDNTNSWVLITSSTNASGNGDVTYLLNYNPANLPRTATVMIANQRLVLSQSANPCPVTLSPASRNHGPEAETNSLNVTNVASCAWTVSNANSWIITSLTNGTGNATLTYRLTPNPMLTSRSGTLRISGQEFTVTQAAATCLYGISPASQTNSFTVQTGVVVLATFSGCNWTVQNTHPWITITPTNGVGSANIYYTLTHNPSSLSRTGVLTIANQAFTLVQSGAPCSFALTPPSSLFGFAAQTSSLVVTTLTGCRWTVSNTNSWIGFLGATNFTNNGNVSYFVTSNATALTRSGFIGVGDQWFGVTQSGVSCSITLTPTNSTAHYRGVTNIFSVASPLGCAWTAAPSNNWITIQSGANGSGTGTVTYVVSPNPASFARTGFVAVANKIFTITQPAAPCTYAISPTNTLFTANDEVGTVDLFAPIGCPWTMVNTNPWVEFLFDTNGFGDATLYYLVAGNSGAARTALVQIAGQTLTIRQLGFPCTFALSAQNVTHSAAPITNSITVNTLAGCTWTVSNTNNWISFPSGTNYSGGGPLTYAITANPLALDRTGTVVVAGQVFTVNQLGITCGYTNSPTSATLTSGNVTGLVSVASSGGCTWVVLNTNGWIAIKSGVAGTNNGLVRFTVQANPSPSVRSAYLTVAGQPFLVTQLGSPCAYTLSSTGRLHGSLSETGQVTILTDAECSWTVQNANPWISITSSTNGIGTAAISYSVDANPGFGDRTGTFTIADQVYTITQLGAACTYTLLTNGAFHGALVETGTVRVTMPLGCTYVLSETNTWITILSNNVGSNSGTINYTVANNVSGAQRVGYIFVGSQPFSVTQATVFCTFAVAPTNVLHGFEAETGLISITTSNPCPWTVLETNSWITINGPTNYTGSTNLSYSLTANPSSLARTGLVTVAGRLVTIRQAGLVCSYTVTPANRAHGFLATTNTVTLTSPTLCSWNVIKSNSWITILTPTNNNVGPATVTYSLQRNNSATPRSSVVTIGGQPFNITQNGAPFLIASNKTKFCYEAWDFDLPVTSGSCGTPGATITILSTTTNLACGPTYVATRIWNATDACSNQVFATQVVTVVTAPPLMFCEPNKSAECGMPWTFDPPLALELCTGNELSIRVVSTITTTNGMCSGFIATRTWEATDSCGNIASCSQTVFVTDTTPPVPHCAPNKIAECGTPWTFDLPTATDGCSGTNVTVRVLSTTTNMTGSCGYTVTRVWDIFDPCTNRTTCSQTVTVQDSTPPTLLCAPNKNVESGTAWDFTPPTASDNCLGPVTLFDLGTTTNNGLCGNTFIATRTWLAEDACGNVDACSQTVVVVDTTPPITTCPPGKTIEYGDVWNFDPPSGTDLGSGTNVTVRILSTVTNTAGFCAPTFSATRTWELADACSNKVTCAQTVTVRDTLPPAITCATNKNINCLAPWSFDAPAVTDIANGTNVTLVVVSTVTNGVCGSGFSATRTWRATDGCNNSATCSQTVFGRGIVNISGTVFCPTNYPASLSDKRVPGATLLGPTNTTALSEADGTFNLMFDAASNVTVSALAPGGDPADGVSTLDISLVRRHILNVLPLDTPYKLLAGDVDASGSISTLDLSFMRRLVLGLTNRFPAGLWRFIPAAWAFPNPLAPWNAPSNYFYPSASVDIMGQDFVAIKLGDLNNSVQVLPGGKAANGMAKGATPTVSFQFSSVTNATPGTSVVVYVTVGDFGRVTTAQGTLAWNPAVLRFVSTEQYGLDGLGSGNFGKTLAPEGKLSFSWDDPNVQGVTVPNGSVMFAVRFDVIGSPGSLSPLAFVDSVAVCEASVDFVPCTFRPVNGQLNVTGSSALRLTPATLGSTAFGVAVPTVAGKNYILEYTDSLPATQWTALPAVPGDGTVKTLSDPSPKAQQRFYRLKVE